MRRSNYDDLVKSLEMASSIQGIAKNTSKGSDINQILSATKEVTSNVAEVSMASDETSAGSRQVNESALELSKLAEDLNSMVTKFKI